MTRAGLFIVFVLNVFVGVSQQKKKVFADPVALKHAEEVVDKAYNYDFDGASKSLSYFTKSYSNHPVYPILSTVIAYQKSVLNLRKVVEDVSYYNNLKLASKYADELYAEMGDADEAIFFELLAHSYLAMYHNENKNHVSAVGEGRKFYKYLKKGYDRKESNPEFYFTSGLFDLYIDVYPKVHPSVAPIMWFFPDGDKNRAMQFFSIGAQKSVFTKPENMSYLIHVNLKYDMKYAEGVKEGARTCAAYPNNLYFRARYAEALVFNKQYEEAKIEIDKLLNSGIEYFQFIGYALNGLYYEHGKNNIEVAKNNYLRAKEIGEVNTNLTYDFLSMVYNGLARAYIHENKKESTKYYYKKSLSIAEYTSVRQEAEAYLD